MANAITRVLVFTAQGTDFRVTYLTQVVDPGLQDGYAEVETGITLPVATSPANVRAAVVGAIIDTVDTELGLILDPADLTMPDLRSAE